MHWWCLSSGTRVSFFLSSAWWVGWMLCASKRERPSSMHGVERFDGDVCFGEKHAGSAIDQLCVLVLEMDRWSALVRPDGCWVGCRCGQLEWVHLRHRSILPLDTKGDRIQPGGNVKHSFSCFVVARDVHQLPTICPPNGPRCCGRASDRLCPLPRVEQRRHHHGRHARESK